MWKSILAELPENRSALLHGSQHLMQSTSPVRLHQMLLPDAAVHQEVADSSTLSLVHKFIIFK